jgi:ABC-type oligopeptide transport system ATPase subunit
MLANKVIPKQIAPKELGEPVITIHHLEKSFQIPGTSNRVKALNDIHLSDDSEFFPIRKGEFIILRGPSGGGKTTLLNILGTIDTCTSGTVGKASRKADKQKFLGIPLMKSAATSICPNYGYAGSVTTRG